MDGNQQRLENLDQQLINIECLLEGGKALEGSNVTTLDLDLIISHLSSQLDTMVPTTQFEGNDSIIFLFSRLTNLCKGLQRRGLDLKGLEILINDAIAKICKANEIEPRQASRSIMTRHC